MNSISKKKKEENKHRKVMCQFKLNKSFLIRRENIYLSSCLRPEAMLPTKKRTENVLGR